MSVYGHTIHAYHIYVAGILISIATRVIRREKIWAAMSDGQELDMRPLVFIVLGICWPALAIANLINVITRGGLMNVYRSWLQRTTGAMIAIDCDLARRQDGTMIHLRDLRDHVDSGRLLHSEIEGLEKNLAGKRTFQKRNAVAVISFSAASRLYDASVRHDRLIADLLCIAYDFLHPEVATAEGIATDVVVENFDQQLADAGLDSCRLHLLCVTYFPVVVASVIQEIRKQDHTIPG